MVQNHQLQYTLVYKRRGSNNSEKITLEGRMLTYVLQDFLQKCLEEDDTGIFFELENADITILEKNPKFHKVIDSGYEYGIILEDVQITTSYRNKYLCELRAKRELLGFTIEEFSNMCCINAGSYKMKEDGQRSMKLNEYAQYMKILELIEMNDK